MSVQFVLCMDGGDHVISALRTARLKSKHSAFIYIFYIFIFAFIGLSNDLLVVLLLLLVMLIFI